ncbi:MAG: hypothetical protein J0H98_09215 [Solirubrobacterales bacterium]|nr:hypothetical protein [Solirubrobacterales bacterium]
MLVSQGECGGDQSEYRLLRLDPDGAWDQGFAGGGVLPLGAGPFLSLITQSTSPLLVGQDGITKYQADGTPDPGFGVNGFASVDFDATPPQDRHSIRAVAVVGGSIYVAGDTYESGHLDTASPVMTKLDLSGEPIASFGTVPGLEKDVHQIAADGSGRIYEASFVQLADPGGGFGWTPRVTRYLPDGTPDLSYGPDGDATAIFPSVLDAETLIGGGVYILKADEAGRIQMGGGVAECSGRCGSGGFWARLDQDGTTPDYGDTGFAITSIDDAGRSAGSYEQEYSMPDYRYQSVVLKPTGEWQSTTKALIGPRAGSPVDAVFGPGDSVFTGGTFDRESNCSSGAVCQTGIYVLKSSAASGSVDQGWGTDTGVATLPALDCPNGVGALAPSTPDLLSRGRCAQSISGLRMKARFGFGASKRPSLKIWLGGVASPDNIVENIGCSDSRLTIQLPARLRIRPRVVNRSLRFDFAPTPSDPARIRLDGHRLTVSSPDNCLVTQSPYNWLRVALPRGSFKPLARRSRHRQLRFGAQLRIWDWDVVEYRGGVKMSAPAVASPKKN